MDYLKLSSSLGHQAQGLLAVHRTVETLIGNDPSKVVVVNKSTLRRMAEVLRGAAEVADRASILLDAEVEVQVPVQE